MSSYHHHDQTSSKPRAKVVKPILRKLTQSERNSLDLDRPAAEQDALGIYGYGGGSGGGGGGGGAGGGLGSRSAHDVNFNHTSRRNYHHRSTSGTSQFSTATSGSGQRTGSFVHPFQQTPRPYTPPLAASYQNSLRESEHSNSPIMTEDDEHMRHGFRNASSLSNTHPTPSLTSPSTVSPVLSPPLRIQTKQPSPSRLALATSHPSLHNALALSVALSPEIASPADTMSSSSAIRTSMDKGFRIRSRSDANRTPTETVQEARRKFDERQKEKDEKAARDDIKALERRNKKEARQYERGQRRSSASETTRSRCSKSDLTMQSMQSMQEKDGFISRDYDSVPHQAPPIASDGFEPPRRSETVSAKKKTHSAWTKFMLWFRTRFIRMGKNKKGHH